MLSLAGAGNSECFSMVECSYARHPRGCGNTEHCAACTIRNTVMATHASGEPHNDVKAYQMFHTESGEDRKMVLISTCKRGDLFCCA